MLYHTVYWTGAFFVIKIIFTKILYKQTKEKQFTLSVHSNTLPPTFWLFYSHNEYHRK